MSAAPSERPPEVPLLEAENVTVHYRVRNGPGHRALLRAVDGVSFALRRGETLGLVGESGSGKSTLGRALVQVEPLTEGVVRLDGQPLGSQGRRELRQQRRRFQMVFQDPAGSLNPRHRVRQLIAEPMLVQGVGPAARRARVAELLDLVGLDAGYQDRHPHTMSGGQQQRVAIARALATSPDIIVCDEAVSALDVSIQAQILNLLARLQDELTLAYLFISHDLAVVRHVADEVAVMYLGRIVEIGAARDLYARPLHPYTKALVSAAPVPDARIERTRPHLLLRGDLPSPTDPPSGCRFRTRCPWAQEQCEQEVPPLRDAGAGHQVACHFFESIESEGGSAPPDAASPSG
jgi:oligopeptide/dipeptide ABC transporter ATP-binding protein